MGVKKLTFPKRNYSQGGFYSKRRTRTDEHLSGQMLDLPNSVQN